MKKRNAMLKGIVFAATVGFASGALAGPTLWVGDSTGNLGTVDTTTGAASVIGNMGNVMTDIAFDPSGNLYGITSSGLYQINKSNAAATFIGSLGFWSTTGRTFNALVFNSSGTLYAAAREGLFNINTTNGLASLVGFAPFFAGGMNSSGDLAFVGGKLYLTSDHFGPDDLWNVNPSNMSSSFPVNFGFGSIDIRTGLTTYSSVFGLASPDNLSLYGVDGTTILNISTTNATATVLANYGGQGLGDAYGSAFYTEAGATEVTAAIPEPETYALMIAGLGLLGFAARRRKLKDAAAA